MQKYELIAEIPEEYIDKPKEALFGVLCRYKMGNGIDLYKDLPYEKNLIPVAFLGPPTKENMNGPQKMPNQKQV